MQSVVAGMSETWSSHCGLHSGSVSCAVTKHEQGRLTRHRICQTISTSTSIRLGRDPQVRFLDRY
ncbi:hypothetical protein SCLCIDRAFT_166693 [Scleroderma citrinum Foug A]|uniref:Uncharacterized protein n=1 Tax=Scleroderma citrinum Foug A TaxID=1036808 RepID=A0A0C3EDI3_9AGAM|nr:hypothetical protein SCLCIDRAFT_166693 [Scleroderma citrinum Foug A]